MNPQSPRVLYLAGNHPNWKEKITYFQSPLWKMVVTKESLNASDVYKSPSNFISSLGGIMDQEICSRAYIFIGNNHSTWSELIAYILRKKRGIKDDEKRVLMMNDNSLDYTDNLRTFCGGNDPVWFDNDCGYFRLPGKL